MRHRIALLGCAIAVVLCGAANARAEVTVLGLRSLEGDEALAEQLTNYLRRFITERGVDTVSDKTQTLEQMMLLAENCGEDVDTRCMREIADLLGASEVVYGFITRMPGESGRFTYAVDVRRFSVSSRRDVESASATIDSTRQGTANLQIAVSTAIDTLWNQETPTTLIVQSNQPGADVYIDDERVGQTGAEPLWVARVSPGEHEVRVEKPGFETWERTVELARDQYRLLEAPLAGEGETVVEVGPEVGPGPGPGPGPVVPPGGGGGEEGGYWSDWHNWAGWGSLGLGVAFGAVGLASSIIVYTNLQEDPNFTLYRQLHSDSANVCDTAQNDTLEPTLAAKVRDVCATSTTYEILQGVMYGLAAVGAGLGIYFLVTADSGEEEEEEESGVALSLSPWGLPSGGGVGLSGTF